MKNQLQTIAQTTLLIVLLTACVSSSDPNVDQIASPISATQMYNLETPVSGIDAQITEALEGQTLSNEFDNMLQKATELKVFSGSVLVVQNGNEILSSGYGFADREKNIPNTSQTRFPICSITKQFTAMAILMLQEQGRLNVQDGICQYLTTCPESWEPITIYQLLTHTSGIPDLLEDYWILDITSHTPLEQLIVDAKSRPLTSPPGEDFNYNNTGYVFLGKIIESASGQPYGTFLKENIFQPLGMLNTGFEPAQNDLAIGYTNQFMTVATQINMWVGYSAGALYSTVEDLYFWDQALYTDELVPQSVLETMFTAHVLIPDSNGMGYGYGWVIGPGNQPNMVGHEGSAYGYRSIIRRYLNDHVTIAILINQEDIDPNMTADLIVEKLLEEE